MNRTEIIVFVTGIVLAVVAAVFGTIFAKRKRREALQALATKLGMTFAEKDDGALAVLMTAGTTLFGPASSRCVSNIIRGNIADLSVYIFEYRFLSGPDRKGSYYQTVAAFFAEQPRAPRFVLKPERMEHRIASLVGFGDIDLPDHPAFSRKYHLIGKPEEKVRSAFRAEVVNRLMQSKKIGIESMGQWMVIYHPGRRLKPHQIEAYLNEAFELCTLFV